MSSAIPNINLGFGASPTQIDKYQVTATGAPFSISLATNYNRVEVYDITSYQNLTTSGKLLYAWWDTAETNGSAYISSGTTTAIIPSYVATSGIYLRLGGYPQQLPAITGGTIITNATPAVATVPSTAGLVNGMNVILYGITGMNQIDQYVFTIGTVTATTFTLPNLPAAGFAAGATSFNVQPVNLFPVIPRANFITAAQSVGTQTVLELSYTHNYWIGMTLTLTIPTNFGVGWNATGAATSVYTVTATGATLNGSTNTITINLNSSTFAPFTFPANTVTGSNQFSPAQVVPIGQQAPPYQPVSSATVYQNTTLVNSSPILTLGSNVCGLANDQLLIYGYTQNTVQNPAMTYNPQF